MTFSRPENADAKEDSAIDRKPGLSSSQPEQSMHMPLGSVESSASLETATPLEAPKPVYTTHLVPVPIASGAPSTSVPSPSIAQTSQPVQTTEALSQSRTQDVSTSTAIEEIALLEERLVIDRHRRKVGEVVVRKEIETHFVQVPVRREKLIVEQISPEYQQLAIVDLGQKEAEVDAIKTASTASSPILRGEFSSVKAAIRFLEAIAAQAGEDAQKVQLGVVLEDAAMQATAQRWLEQYTAQKAASVSS